MPAEESATVADQLVGYVKQEPREILRFVPVVDREHELLVAAEDAIGLADANWSEGSPDTVHAGGGFKRLGRKDRDRDDLEIRYIGGIGIDLRSSSATPVRRARG